MATVSARFTFRDGDSVGASVEVDAGYPDALAEATARCVDLLREAMVTGLVVQQDEDDD